MIYQHREWAVKADALMLEAMNTIIGHQSIDLIDQVDKARRELNVCLQCGAIRDEPCLSGGYAPVGALLGDPIKKPHKERRARR